MVKVINWIDITEVPANLSVNDMRYGIGCMNDLLMDLINKMASVLQKNSASNNPQSLYDMLKNFEGSTFGRQIIILKKCCPGLEITYNKMEELLKNRNHFIHEYRTSSGKKEGKLLFDTINLLVKLNGQMDNAIQKVSKDISKKKKSTEGEQKRRIVKIIRNLGTYYPENVPLSAIGKELSRNGIEYEGGLLRTIEKYNWEVVYYIDHPTVKLVVLDSVR